MRYAHILIGTLFCLLVQQDIHAQTLYTWKDDAGTIHITQQKPPPGQPLADRMHYRARLSSRPQVKPPSPDETDDDAVLEAARQAKQARKHAENARKMAEEAIQNANREKRAAEIFLEPWRGKKRIRKQTQLQIESRIKKANQFIAKAQDLIASANEAESKAQAAEKKAQRTQDQFFRAYRTIISK